jgi:hypothetical protein
MPMFASGHLAHHSRISFGSVVALFGQSLMSGFFQPGRQGKIGIPLLAILRALSFRVLAGRALDSGKIMMKVPFVEVGGL